MLQVFNCPHANCIPGPYIQSIFFPDIATKMALSCRLWLQSSVWSMPHNHGYVALVWWLQYSRKRLLCIHPVVNITASDHLSRAHVTIAMSILSRTVNCGIITSVAQSMMTSSPRQKQINGAWFRHIKIVFLISFMGSLCHVSNK